MLKRRGYSIDPEALATSALAFLAADPERLGRFLATSGLDPSNIRSASRNPNFLPSVLDHLMTDDRLLIAFAESENIRPETIAETRAAFSHRDR